MITTMLDELVQEGLITAEIAVIIKRKISQRTKKALADKKSTGINLRHRGPAAKNKLDPQEEIIIKLFESGCSFRAISKYLTEEKHTKTIHANVSRFIIRKIGKEKYDIQLLKNKNRGTLIKVEDVL
jgi:DNA-binding NarL/FixJ family response regulator